MISEQQKTEAYIAQLYFQFFNKMECKVKEIFFEDFENQMDPNLQKRLLYYAGWMFCDLHLIDFDSYSLKRELMKFDPQKNIKRMSFKQIIKFSQNEPQYKRFDINIPSFNKKMESVSFYYCCTKFIDMRNKLAHLFDEFDFSKNTIEILQGSQLDEFSQRYLDGCEYKELTTNAIYILSNYVYLRKIYNILLGENE